MKCMSLIFQIMMKTQRTCSRAERRTDITTRGLGPGTSCRNDSFPLSKPSRDFYNRYNKPDLTTDC